jgi:hypothetical protein
MMFRPLIAGALLVIPAAALAQINTTGTLASNGTVAQGATRSTTTQGTTTNGTTTGTTGTATGMTGTTTGNGATTGIGTTTGTTGTTAGAIAGTPRDAAIITCAEDISTGANRLVVFSSSVSTGGPTIAPMAACAQALADLFAGGYGLIDVQQVNQQVQYTLVR